MVTYKMEEKLAVWARGTYRPGCHSSFLYYPLVVTGQTVLAQW